MSAYEPLPQSSASLDAARAQSARSARPSARACAALAVSRRTAGLFAVGAVAVTVIALGTALSFRGAAPGGPRAPPGVLLGNTAAPSTFLPAIGLGTGAYGSQQSVGYGQYPECGQEAFGCGNFSRRAVREWIAVGGRRIDASNDYGNQVSVGLGIADGMLTSGVRRDELFVLSKVGPGMSLGYSDAKAQFACILSDMKLDYLDALLVHWPDASLHDPQGDNPDTNSSEAACRPRDPAANATQCRLDTWRALVELWRAGGVRAVGVSNYNQSHLGEIEAAGAPLPALNQLVVHPYRSSSQAALIAHMRARGVVVDAYSPLGVPDAHAFPRGADPAGALAPSVLADPIVAAVAAAHAPATPAQVVLAWLWAQGLPSVPRSQNASHMADNLRALGGGGAQPLALSRAELDALSARPQNQCGDDGGWYESVGFPC